MITHKKKIILYLFSGIACDNNSLCTVYVYMCCLSCYDNTPLTLRDFTLPVAVTRTLYVQV